MQIEVRFPVVGDELPTDHAYLLYASLSRVVPDFHEARADIRFSPVNGDKGEKGRIRLTERSRLSVRLAAEEIARVLPLAGRCLEVGSHRIHLHVPTVTPLIPVTMLAARIVTFKNATDPSRFLDISRQRLAELGIAGEPGIPLIQNGDRAGEPRRQILRIKGLQVVGYALRVCGLSAEESVLLQEKGLGGRRRIGCGFFVPYRPRTP